MWVEEEPQNNIANMMKCPKCQQIFPQEITII